MSTTRLPLQVEPYRLAASGEHLEGAVSLEEMVRLREEAGEQQGDAQVCLEFAQDAQGRRLIEGWVKTTLDLACKRCLESMPVVIDSHFLLGMVSDDAMAANLPAAYEPVVVENEQLNLQLMLEDELILSLPQVVYHDETDCAVSPDQLSSGTLPESSERPAASPFEVLRALKKKH
ncbi:YceD family protein [Halomonas sp. GXIMD04776]|uniref:YceD family protein n=1 Tax=Halomonas sp. GXIMD04776 TaxID=3415605 RepID=UPI003C882D76